MDEVLPPLTHAPDGLYESDIDALIDECFTADNRTVSDRVAANRHTRRLSRQAVNAALRNASVEPTQVDDAAA